MYLSRIEFSKFVSSLLISNGVTSPQKKIMQIWRPEVVNVHEIIIESHVAEWTPGFFSVFFSVLFSLSQKDFLQETDVFEVFPDDKEVKTCMSAQTEVSRFTSLENRVKRFSGLSSLLTAVSAIVRVNLEKKGKSVSKIESMEIAQRNLIKCIQRETLECPSSKLLNALLRNSRMS